MLDFSSINNRISHLMGTDNKSYTTRLVNRAVTALNSVITAITTYMDDYIKVRVLETDPSTGHVTDVTPDSNATAPNVKFAQAVGSIQTLINQMTDDANAITEHQAEYGTAINGSIDAGDSLDGVKLTCVGGVVFRANNDGETAVFGYNGFDPYDTNELPISLLTTLLAGMSGAYKASNSASQSWKAYGQIPLGVGYKICMWVTWPGGSMDLGSLLDYLNSPDRYQVGVKVALVKDDYYYRDITYDLQTDGRFYMKLGAVPKTNDATFWSHFSSHSSDMNYTRDQLSTLWSIGSISYYVGYVKVDEASLPSSSTPLHSERNQEYITSLLLGASIQEYDELLEELKDIANID